MARMISILALVCLCSALVLGITNKITAPAIAQQMSKEEKSALNSVLPEADNFDEAAAGKIKYYKGTKDSQLVGYCLLASAPGYSSNIQMMVGLDTSGVIRGVKVLSQQETPGLGTRITEIKQGEKSPWFLNQLKGKYAKSIKLKDIDAITGATISSRAVTDGIRNTTNEFLEKLR